MVRGVILGLSNMDYFLLMQHNIFFLSLQLMIPVAFFFCTVGFFFSTVIRNGHGAGMVVILLALIAWFVQGSSSDNAAAVVWSVFFNPFNIPNSTSQLAWDLFVAHNRTHLLVASVIDILWGLLYLQKRELFIK